MPKLEWTTEKRRVADLIPMAYNPRTMSEDQARQLQRSIAKFNLVEIPVIDVDGTIIAGHMRVEALKTLGRGNDEIDVRVPSRPLTKAERDEYNLRSNKNTGDWDFDALGNAFEMDMLTDVGFTEKDFNLGDSEDEKSGKARQVTCPHCGEEFEL